MKTGILDSRRVGAIDIMEALDIPPYKKHLNLWIVEGEVNLKLTMEFPPSTDLGLLRPKPRDSLERR